MSSWKGLLGLGEYGSDDDNDSDDAPALELAATAARQAPSSVAAPATAPDGPHRLKAPERADGADPVSQKPAPSSVDGAAGEATFALLDTKLRPEPARRCAPGKARTSFYSKR